MGWRSHLFAGALALVCVLVVQVSQVRINLNLGDEGQLWYGVQRVLKGEVPLRDFHYYYDPGRFYLLAAWAWIWRSDGIVTLRYGIALVQWLAMVPTIAMLLSVDANRWRVGIYALSIAFGMEPRHKMFDIAALVWCTWALAELVRHPSGRYHFLLGAVVGILWFIARNHALYSMLAAMTVEIVLVIDDRRWRELGHRFLWLLSGLALGAAPMIVFLLGVKGFATAYWKIAVLRVVMTPAPTLPIPWPLRFPFDYHTWSGVSADAVSLGFLFLPIVIVLGMAVLIWHGRNGRFRQHPLLLSATVTTALWAHHSFSWADQPHLMQTMASMSLALIALAEALPGARVWLWRGTAWAMLGIVTTSALIAFPIVAAHLASPDCGWHSVGGEQLYLPAQTTRVCDAAESIVHRMSAGESVLFVPYVPGLYAVFRLQCPTREPYPLFAETLEQQMRDIQSMNRRRTDWVVYWPYRIMGLPQLGFDRTNQLEWQFILDHFVKVDTIKSAEGAEVYHRR